MSLGRPSEAPSGGGIQQYEGCLLVLTLTGRGESQFDANSKVKPSVTLDVLVIDSSMAGQRGTQTNINKEPATISAKPGDRAAAVTVSQGYIVGSFNQAPLGKVIAGRLVNRLIPGPGGQPARTWLLDDPSDAEYAAASAAYEASQRPSLGTPSAAAPAAVAASALPQGDPEF